VSDGAEEFKLLDSGRAVRSADGRTGRRVTGV